MSGFTKRWLIRSVASIAIPVAISVGAFCFARPAYAGVGTVTVYTSQDEVYAEPIFKDFERQSGIKVKAVFDSEAVKTVGLVNRLFAEQSHPQCDVFWNNEEMRTRLLASRGLFRETNGWAATTAFRTRRIVINTNMLSAAQAPANFTDVTNAAWRGKVAIAYPMFGTTSTHFLALRNLLGDKAWQDWCRALAANKPMLVDGNSVVVKLVGGGEAALGFTDYDDICAGQEDGLPVAALPVNAETLFIPNTIGVMRGAPHPAEAEKLFEYLQSDTVRAQLVKNQALEPSATKAAKGLKVDWNDLLKNLDSGTAEMKGIFLR